MLRKAACGWFGARQAFEPAKLVGTDTCLTRRFGASKHVGQRRRARYPANRRTPRTRRSTTPCCHPRRHRHESGRAPMDGCPATASSWSRSRKSFTGRPATRARRAPSTPHRSTSNLEPNPPPMYWVWMRTFEAGISMRLCETDTQGRDRLRRCPHGQLVSTPLRRSDRADSRQQWLIIGIDSVRSMVTAAPARASSGSPLARSRAGLGLGCGVEVAIVDVVLQHLVVDLDGAPARRRRSPRSRPPERRSRRGPSGSPSPHPGSLCTVATPARASAADTSIERIRAWAWGLVRMRP